MPEYYHHLFLERKKDVPEFYHDIGYPFKAIYLDVGHGIDDVELNGLLVIK